MSTLKILIINPITSNLVQSPNLGITYIAGAIENAGYDVSIIDANSIFGEYSLNTLYKEVAKLKPDILGFSFCTEDIPIIYKQIKALKKLAGLVIAGGPHPTVLPDEVLDNGVDVVIRGEGEDTVVDFLRTWESAQNLDGIPGISFHRGEEHVHNSNRPLIENLDKIKPARHLINFNNYSPKGSQKLFENILTSRGCPCKCTFCSSVAMGREKVRVHSAEYVIGEIINLYNQYNFKFVRISDDTFTWYRERTEQICRMLIEMPKLGAKWSCVTRTNKVDPELLRLMHKAGCFQITFGLESFVPETLKRIKKGILVEQSMEIAIESRKIGFDVKINIIQGWPWEKSEHVDQIALGISKLIKEGIKSTSTGMLVPYPGTEIYNTYHEEYGFTDWWLKERYDPSAIQRKPWFRTHIAGDSDENPVLKKDFFRYSSLMKKKYNELMKKKLFCYQEKRRKMGPHFFYHWALYISSKFSFAINPEFEKITIKIITNVVRFAVKVFQSTRL